MTDEPIRCALPGCDAIIEQPDDGGPPRRYCTPAHRAAARRKRHEARLDATVEEASATEAGAPVAPPAPLAARTPREDPPRTEDLSQPDGRWSPAASWTISPTPPPPLRERTLNRKAARTAGERRAAATSRRRRAVAGLAIVSLVAGGGGYLVTETTVPVAPPVQQPPPVAQPVADADQWVTRAEVVLASIDEQLEAVAQTEATWARLPEHRRSGQPPAPVQALLDRKALLEQQRATLTSQLGALRALPEVRTDLTAAQAQLEAVERALATGPDATTSAAQAEAVRRLQAQRELHMRQRDHNAQELASLRDGVEKARAAPLPEVADATEPIVSQVMALIERRPDPQPQEARDRTAVQAAVLPRRDGDRGHERQDVSPTAPPNPSRPTLVTLPQDPRAAGDHDHHDDKHRDDEHRDDERSRAGGSNGNVVTHVAANTVGVVRKVLRSDDDSSHERSDHRRADADRHHSQSDDRKDDRERRDRADDEKSDSKKDDSKKSGSKNKKSDDEKRPVAELVSNVTHTVGSVLGGSDDDRKRSSSAKDDSSKPVGKAERARDKEEHHSRDSQSRGSREDDRSDRDGHHDRHEEQADRDASKDHGNEDEKDSSDSDSRERKKPSGKAQRAKDKAAAEEARDKAGSLGERLEERGASDDRSGSGSDQADDGKKDDGKSDDSKKDDGKKSDGKKSDGKKSDGGGSSSDED
ncbi:hypothetical protein [Pseudonocardia nigra]|uniref:hypothetical protein n=1 Tax=Pseudonocardia nigra TaxID=1921578 RepID=UPI001C5D4980|nr:hypothetical protein [Pseudonocardia nigra]